jgi:CheY-like chemotaxis protein
VATLTLNLLGEVSLTDSGGNDLPIGSDARALLIYVALSEAASIAEAGELMGDPHTALEELEGAVVEETGLLLIPDADTDAKQFRDLVEEGTLTSAREATDLYRGDLLRGFSTGKPALDRWIDQQRGTYRRMAESAFGQLLAAQVKAGWWHSARINAHRLLDLDPTEEVVHRTLMRVNLEENRPDDAIARYEECAAMTRRVHGREPDEETRQLAARARAIRDGIKRQEGPSRASILLLEDDPVTSAIIENYLREAGHEIVSVIDGADALVEIATKEFDLLILDVNVPTLSGLKLFEIMLRKGFDTPAMFITGVPGHAAEVESLELGAADFLRKPIQKDSLLSRVRGILQRRGRDAAPRRRAAN